LKTISSARRLLLLLDRRLPNYPGGYDVAGVVYPNYGLHGYPFQKLSTISSAKGDVVFLK
jgi:hypothetical protein